MRGWVAVAAAVVFLLLVGAYFLLSAEKQPAEAQQVDVNAKTTYHSPQNIQRATDGSVVFSWGVGDEELIGMVRAFVVRSSPSDKLLLVKKKRLLLYEVSGDTLKQVGEAEIPGKGYFMGPAVLSYDGEIITLYGGTVAVFDDSLNKLWEKKTRGVTLFPFGDRLVVTGNHRVWVFRLSDGQLLAEYNVTPDAFVKALEGDNKLLLTATTGFAVLDDSELKEYYLPEGCHLIRRPLGIYQSKIILLCARKKGDKILYLRCGDRCDVVADVNVGPPDRVVFAQSRGGALLVVSGDEKNDIYSISVEPVVPGTAETFLRRIEGGFSSAVLADVDGDDKKEAYVKNDRMEILSYPEGKVLATLPGALVDAFDVDGDGADEAVVMGAGKVHVVGENERKTVPVGRGVLRYIGIFHVNGEPLVLVQDYDYGGFFGVRP